MNAPRFRCPDCHTALALPEEATSSKETCAHLRCAPCNREFPRVGSVWDLWPASEPLTAEDRWWRDRFDESSRKLGAEDPLAVDYDSRRTFDARQRELQALVGRREGSLLLDVGCGNGLMTRPWTRGSTVVGVDGSLEMAQAAARNGLQPVHAPAFELPFVDGSFDGAFLIEVLQIVSDPYRVLSELTRVVRPGGFVVLLTHNAESLVRRVLYRFFPDEGPAHRMFTLPQLSGWLTSLGCGKVKGRHLFLPVPYSRPASGLPASLLATTLALRAEKLA